MNDYTRITTWNPGRGFGFVIVSGRKVFVHATDIHPQPDLNSDLTGQTIVVESITKEERGWRVSRAYTPEEFEREQAERLQAQQKATEALLAEQRKIQEAKTNLETRRGDILEEVVRLYADHKIPRYEGVYLADNRFQVRLVQTEAKIISEKPFRLQGGVFAKVQFLQKPHGYETLAEIQIGPIVEFSTRDWAGLTFGYGETSMAMVVGNPFGRDQITWSQKTGLATIEFVAIGHLSVAYHRSFPIEVEAPYRDREQIIQKIRCRTPCGVIEHRLPLFPERDYTDYPTFMKIWGGHDLTALVAEASLMATREEIRQAFLTKFKAERIPTTWSESGNAWQSHEDVGTGIGMGGDYVSVDYENADFTAIVDRVYAQGVLKSTLEQATRLPAEAEAVDWHFAVPSDRYGRQEWPAVFIPLVETYGKKDSDLKGYTVPRWISPLQRPGYSQALEAVLGGMSAKEAVEKFLGPCPRPHPLEIVAIARWARNYRMYRKNYSRLDGPPIVSSSEIAQRGAKLFESLEARYQRKKEAQAAEEKRLAEVAFEKKRVADIATVRTNWKQMDRGSYGLHEEARDLLRKIWRAQQMAEAIRARKVPLRTEVTDSSSIGQPSKASLRRRASVPEKTGRLGNYQASRPETQDFGTSIGSKDVDWGKLRL